MDGMMMMMIVMMIAEMMVMKVDEIMEADTDRDDYE